MISQRVFSFSDLGLADLIVDARYEGGSHGDVRDDPLARLVGGGNQGGFRYVGGVTPFTVRHCVLYSDLADPDWPDRLDLEAGRFTYYGDNKTPGGELHKTSRRGNEILREIFTRLHSGQRHSIPPFLIFTKAASGRAVVFRGLAAPGAPGVSQTEDLVAIWKSKGGKRFQNYRAIFTILDTPSVTRRWIEGLKAGDNSRGEPTAWLKWRESGQYDALVASRTKEHRSPREQVPAHSYDLKLLHQIVDYYSTHPQGRYAFERCAAQLFQLMQPSAHSIDLTRPWRDGGRDAVGLFRIGKPPSAIDVEFALEAKCKRPAQGNSSGVRETARLVARIRHRQFGVFVTTSCIGEQAYMELVEDGHPVIVLAGTDIVRVLREHGLGTSEALGRWLEALANA